MIKISKLPCDLAQSSSRKTGKHHGKGSILVVILEYYISKYTQFDSLITNSKITLLYIYLPSI